MRDKNKTYTHYSFKMNPDTDMKFMDVEQIDNIFEVILGENKTDG